MHEKSAHHHELRRSKQRTMANSRRAICLNVSACGENLTRIEEGSDLTINYFQSTKLEKFHVDRCTIQRLSLAPLFFVKAD